MTLRLLVAACLPLGLGLPTVHAAPSPAAAAAAVDAALAGGTTPGPRADDATFLRRITLDLTGKLPDPAAIDRFVADVRPDKRAKVVDDLLGTEAYAINWGRYWRDAVTYHTPASATTSAGSCSTAGGPTSSAATGRGTRSSRPRDGQRHQRRAGPGQLPDGPVRQPGRDRGHHQPGVPRRADPVRRVPRRQGRMPWKRRAVPRVRRLLRPGQADPAQGRGRPRHALRHREPRRRPVPHDRQEGPDRLIDMPPRFFTGEGLGLDAGRRRAPTGRWRKVLTDPKNPWFAKCYVNRMWTALLGWGFYPTVTDLGPTAEAVRHKDGAGRSGEGLDRQRLRREVAVPHHRPDARPTSAASARLARRRAAAGRLPGAAAAGAGLRGASERRSGFDENDKTIPAPAPGVGPGVPRHTGLRHMVYQAFKANPSPPPPRSRGPSRKRC